MEFLWFHFTQLKKIEVEEDDDDEEEQREHMNTLKCKL